MNPPSFDPATNGRPAIASTSVDEHTPVERVVVGVDGSDSSKQALRWAANLAGSLGAGLHAVMTWEPLTDWGMVGAGYAPVPSDWNPSLDAEKLLVATVDEVFGAHRPSALELLVRQGNAAQVLLELSAAARMLVVGSRGHGGFVGLLLGSVSAACAEQAECPVLVVH